MDTSLMSRILLLQTCKELKITRFHSKNKSQLIELISIKRTFQNEKKDTLVQLEHIPNNMYQDTGKFRTNNKDQFYTNETVAKTCIQMIIDLLPFTTNYLWIEPSAGSGSFLHNLPSSFKKIGLDLEPNAKDILIHDYLTWTPPCNQDVIVFGNPPFGRQSSLAKAFISKSCQFAKIIAFILPKSFTKPSMIKAFDLKFHLIQSFSLEKYSFLLNGTKYDVPCIFQIWQKKDINRSVEEKVNPYGFTYVKSTDTYDIAFRRVGGLAGKCYVNDGSFFSVQSHYFIKCNDDIVCYLNTIIQKINMHVFPSNTVGPRSLSKSEVNAVINTIIQTIS